MNHKAQFERVTAICEHLKAERGSGEHTPNEVTSVATAYLLACDRTGRFHHPEDNATGVFEADDDGILAAQHTAFDLMWDIIGPASSKTNDARYTAAWDVWGVMLHSDECPGMQPNTIS